MKKNLLKCLCLLLCICTILPLAVSCKKGDEGGDDGSSVTTKSESSVNDDGVLVDENGYELDSIDRTLTGKTIRMLVDSSSKGDVWPEESTNGKYVTNDRTYLRNLALMERLECNVEIVDGPGEWSGMTNFIQIAEQAQDYELDLICAYSLVPAVLAQRGLLVNLNNLQYPEFEKPWWPNMLESWENDGALYFVSSNSSYRVINAMECVLANRRMIDNYKLDSIEDTVISGKWTLEVMQNYVKAVDINSEDEFGLVVDDHSRMDMFLYGAGNYMTEKDSNGVTQLVLFDESNVDKVTTLVDKLYAIFRQNGTMLVDGRRNGETDKKILKNAQAMFYGVVGLFELADQVSDTSTYIAIPAPKYDGEQENYYTIPNNSYDVWSIPKSTADREDSALFLEAMASADYRDSAPYIFDVKFKLRYSNDEKGSQIFDIIRNSFYVDFGRVYANALGVMEAPFRDCFWNGSLVLDNNSYASSLENKTTVYKSNMKTVLAALTKYAEE